jgi:hypothetical protein
VESLVCPRCGERATYVGLNDADCTNPDCENYSHEEAAQAAQVHNWEQIYKQMMLDFDR